MSHRPSRRGVYADRVMSEADDLIREQRERFNREFDRIGCLALVVEVLVLLAVAGAVLATSNVIDLFRGE